MKIVINRCWGGFGLSPIGSIEYLRLNGLDGFCYKQTKYSFRDGIEEYTKVSPNESDASLYHISKIDLGDTTTLIPNEYYFSSYSIDRADENLIKIVENMGGVANGNCAKLSVVEIPDDVEWEIEEYDGMETVREVSRSWY